MVSFAFELSPKVLREHGISAVLVDLDDTLLASKSEHLGAAYYDWFSSLKSAGIPAFILSNGTRSRVARWSQELGVQGSALSGKPFWGFKRGLAELGVKAEQTAMVGDQLFTDVLGAKLVGMKSILVKPLSNRGLLHTRFLRTVERFMLKGSK